MGVFNGLVLVRGRRIVEGGVTVLEEILEAGIELIGVEVEFIAQVGDGDLSMNCLSKMATFSVPEECRRRMLMMNLRWGFANPSGAFFQFRLEQDSTTEACRVTSGNTCVRAL